MKTHTRIYFKALCYHECDFIPSELSGQKSVDINHIICRGMGGNPSGDLDRIENLMAVTREEHVKHGDRKKDTAMLLKKHRAFLLARYVKFDNNWFEEMINKYENS